ncbi:MAG: 3-deoxy-8-phosphooctulonate synthase [Bacillota bacterium]
MKEKNKVKLNEDIVFGSSEHPFVLLAGPCVLETRERALKIGAKIKEITSKLGIPFVFKSSFDKANRSSIESYRGPGLEQGLKVLAEIGEKLDVPLITDIHLPGQAEKVARVVDIIQVPAFLSRQTDLLTAAGNTGKVINVKKGQFLAPGDIKQVVGKLESTGNRKILLTERGASFGYNNLVVDMRSLVIMGQTGYPVVFDATHSVQLPGGAGNKSGGQREFVFPLARAAAAVGVEAFFMEVHDRPEEALCDGPNMVRLDQLEKILRMMKKISNLTGKGELK